MWIETLQEFDKEIFYLINSKLSNVIFDYYLPILRNKYTWIPVYIFILTYLAFNLKKRSVTLMVFLFLAVGVSDAVSSHLIKKMVKRTRPCNDDTVYVMQRVSCGSGYSFTSSHAANHFAISLYLMFAVARRRAVKWLLILWAVIVSFAQIYVGVHYPMDVLFGAGLGIFLGWTGYQLWKRVDDKVAPLRDVSVDQ